MKKISSQQLAQALDALKQGLSVRKVQDATGLSKSTVSNIRKQHLADLPVNKAGRPRALTNNQKRYATRLVTSGAMNTAAEVQRHLRQTGVVSVNAQTIRRTLKSVGLRSGLKRKVPHLTPRHRKLRYEWAKAHKNWSINQWRKVIWSDETKINLFGSDGRRWCWKNRGKGLESRVIIQTRKYGGGNIMVWGCMTAQGAGFATRIIGNMDAALYQDILKGELVQTLDWYDLERGHVIFQHDNDPKHTAHSTTEILSTQHWAVLDWPPQSPDMNPIEHLWKHVKNELYLDSEMPTNKDDLWVKVERIWDSIDPAVCLNLIDSMPRRVEALLKARGGHTKY